MKRELFLTTALSLAAPLAAAQTPVWLCNQVPGGNCEPQGTYSVSAMLIGSGAGSTAAVTATLASAAGKTTLMCGFAVSAIGGTAAVGPITVGSLFGTTSLSYQLAASASGNTLSVTYNPCLPAVTVNSAITVTTTADGTASNVSVNVWGFLQ